MLQGLLLIAIVYAAGAFAVHAAYRRCGGHVPGAKHYVLHTMNDQRHVEWAVRSLTLFCWLSGKPVTITIVDEGSTDDTLEIVRRLSRRHGFCIRSAAEDTGVKAVPVLDIAGAESAEIVHFRLYRPEDMEKLLHAYR